MPRRKTNNTTKTAKAKEEDLEEIPLYLRDFHSLVKQVTQQLDEQSNSVIAAISTRYKMNLSKLSLAEKNLTLESFWNKKTVDEEDEFMDVVDQRLTSIKPSARKPRLQSARKAGSASTRRSTRKRAEESPLSKIGMFTPAQKGVPVTMGQTPMITPKFNPMTPLNRTVHRQARPNETLVSLEGSPVRASAVKARGKKKTGAEEFAQIPLGGAYTLSLPIAADIDNGGLELDADQIQKLAILNEGIANILKGRTISAN